MSSAIVRLCSSVQNDPNRPNIVWAPSPHDKNAAIRLQVHPATIRRMADDFRYSAIAQYAGHIHGAITIPDTSGQGQRIQTGGLLQAIALFQGLKRPMIDADRDSEVYVLVANPRSDFLYPGKRFDGSLFVPVPAPVDSVFTTFFVLAASKTAQTLALEQYGEEEIADGLILNWEWTLRSTDDARLPDDFGNRYRDRIWMR